MKHPGTVKNKILNFKDFDFTVDPADDFYRYVNGGWLKRNKIPKTENRWGSFLILRDKTKKDLRILMEKISKNTRARRGSDQQKMRDLYLSGMDVKKRNKDGAEALKQKFRIIENMRSKNDLISVLVHLHEINVYVPWVIYTDQDDQNSKKIVLRLHQSGLGMPNRDYYLKNDDDSKRVRTAYKKYIRKISTLIDRNDLKNIQRTVATILLIETKLAKASMSRTKLRNISSQYNKKSIKELQKLAPMIEWHEYFRGIKVKNLRTVIVDQPDFLKEVNNLFSALSLSKWKVYLRWHLIRVYASKLSDDFVDANFDFYGKTIMGTEKMPPRWKRCLEMVDGVMGEALGREYVAKHFPPKAKRKVNALVNDLIAAYAGRINELDWMTFATKKKAIEKLHTIERKLGYPEKWQSYKKLHIHPDSYAQNYMNAALFEFHRNMAKLGKPVDRKEWGMSPPTINAYYHPNLNQIVFPAGILQPPFFNLTADDAINYGAIGAVIGHELTHGFDDQGSQFDNNGNFKNWWAKNDKKRFEEKTKILVTQFNSYKITNDMHINGKLTLGENIADLGGLVLAFRALQRSLKRKRQGKIDGFTPEQRFFISAAIVERELVRDEFLKLQVRNNPHSPGEFRVNGPLANMVEFYEAFQIKNGDNLFRKEKDRVSIW